MKAALFDYGAGNLHSLAKALEASGARVAVTSDWDEALSADGLVLPGVGAFGQAAAALPRDRSRLRDALRSGYPCLGICLGMQILFERSAESGGEGAAVIPGSVVGLESRIVPHMGWNDVEVGPDPLFDGIDGLVAYYAHSFVCDPESDGVAIAWSTYEGARFPAAVRIWNCWAVQFHPEKSSAQGLRLLENFIRNAGTAQPETSA